MELVLSFPDFKDNFVLFEYTTIGFTMWLFHINYLFIELPENMLYHDVFIEILNDLYRDRRFCPYPPALPPMVIEVYPNKMYLLDFNIVISPAPTSAYIYPHIFISHYLLYVSTLCQSHDKAKKAGLVPNSSSWERTINTNTASTVEVHGRLKNRKLTEIPPFGKLLRQSKKRARWMRESRHSSSY